LVTKIKGLGAESDVVKVKAGFARNFLIPFQKAYEATQDNLQHMDDLKKARAEREAVELEEANKIAKAISALKLTFDLETGETGKAFGSVTSIDIHKKLEDKGIEIDRTAIQLKNPIKSSGSQEIGIKLHSEVSTTLTVKVNGGAVPEPKKEAVKTEEPAAEAEVAAAE